MWIAIVWLVLAIVIGAAAGARGRSGFGWFLLAVLISPLLAGLILAMLPDLRTRALFERLADGGAVDDAALARAVRSGAPAPPKAADRAWWPAAVGIAVIGLLALLYLASHG